MYVVAIHCDGCGQEGAVIRDKQRRCAHTMRSSLAKVGWKNAGIGAPSGEDWCPRCWQGRKNAGIAATKKGVGR